MPSIYINTANIAKIPQFGNFYQKFTYICTPNYENHETKETENHFRRLHPCEPQGCKDGGD